MATDPSWPSEPAGRYSLSTLLAPADLMRLGIIALVLLGVASAFAWTAGWLSPGRLDQVRLIDTFEAVNGAHPGFRRNHAKGVCLVGWFDSSGAGARLSGATVFAAGRIPVVGRLSIVGPSPEVADGSEAVRSMALDFTLPDGEAWRTSMNDLPVFPVKDAQGFYEQLVALKPDPCHRQARSRTCRSLPVGTS
jgi:catalase